MSSGDTLLQQLNADVANAAAHLVCTVLAAEADSRHTEAGKTWLSRRAV